MHEHAHCKWQIYLNLKFFLFKYHRIVISLFFFISNILSEFLIFSHFSNPLFILTTLAIFFFNNKDLGIILLVSHYLSNFILGLLFRKYFNHNDKLIGNVRDLKNDFAELQKLRNEYKEFYTEIQQKESAAKVSKKALESSEF